MSVGVLPGMGTYSGGAMPAVAADQNAVASVNAGMAVPRIGTQNIGGKLALSIGADGTVAGTIFVFAVLYFGVMLAFHQLDRFG